MYNFSFYPLFKSASDRIFALFFIIILSPFLLGIGFLVFINLGFPIFFLQNRPGFRGQNFTLIKFRSMTVHDNSDYLSDSERLSRFGVWLRSTSSR